MSIDYYTAISLNKTIDHLMEPIMQQDTSSLRAKAADLKQHDGESWAIGEVIERCCQLKEKAVVSWNKEDAKKRWNI